MLTYAEHSVPALGVGAKTGLAMHDLHVLSLQQGALSKAVKISISKAVKRTSDVLWVICDFVCCSLVCVTHLLEASAGGGGVRVRTEHVLWLM